MAAHVFTARPMDTKTVQYCANDVTHLTELHALYLKRMQGDWLARAIQESERRVEVSYKKRVYFRLQT
jgi:exonuclease 3'-5' domain-containing protein 1